MPATGPILQSSRAPRARLYQLIAARLSGDCTAVDWLRSATGLEAKIPVMVSAQMAPMEASLMNIWLFAEVWPC